MAGETDLKKPSDFNPDPVACNHCDFSRGTRGMDRCSRCDGTGSGFRVALAFYPNTKEGFDAACQALAEAANALAAQQEEGR